jgi:hypothetical protein
MDTHIAVVDMTSSQASSVSLQQYPELLKEFGCITGYQHKPRVDPTITPVRQPLRRLPLVLRDEVSAELKQMLKLDLIEKVNASPWISNLVLVRKPDKKLRLCSDPLTSTKPLFLTVFPYPLLRS